VIVISVLELELELELELPMLSWRTRDRGTSQECLKEMHIRAEKTLQKEGGEVMF
jgi:hypothetical protein